MTKLTQSTLSICLLFLLNGCATQYQYTPPSSETGLKCVMQCQNIQAKCHSQEEHNANIAQRECQENAAHQYEICERDAVRKFHHCRKKAKHEYNSCLRYAPDRSVCIEDTCQKDYCYEDSCFKSANYEVCDESYRQCYQGCGGTVEVVK